MAEYSIRCESDNCDYHTTIFCKYMEMQEELGKNCPECNEKELYHSLETMVFKLKGGCWAKDGYA